MPSERVGILAVQGAFAEHEHMLSELGARCVELRQASDLGKGFDQLVLPGGESTAQGRMLRELDMLGPLRSMVEAGMPTLGTCAGLILMAKRIDDVNGDGASSTASTTPRGSKRFRSRSGAMPTAGSSEASTPTQTSRGWVPFP